MRRRRAQAVGVTVVLVVGAACSSEPERVSTTSVIQPGRPGEPATTLPPGSTFSPSADPFTEADAVFLVRMIPHHEQALAMAELAPGRAEHPDVLGMAARIADVQAGEIDVYERWLADHDMAPDGGPAAGGREDHDDMGEMGDMAGMAAPERLAELEAASDADFDRRWLTLMIEHHEGALAMARERDSAGTNQRVGEFSADVFVT